MIDFSDIDIEEKSNVINIGDYITTSVITYFNRNNNLRKRYLYGKTTLKVINKLKGKEMNIPYDGYIYKLDSFKYWCII